MDEKFYPLKDYEAFYEISKTGVVRSLDRLVDSSYNSKRIAKGKIITPDLSNRGYYRIPLTKKGTGKRKFSLHRLLAINFIKNPNNYPVVNHIDNNPLNNNLSNLEWCTQSQNMKHKFDTGYAHHRRSLSDEAVIDIFLNCKKGTFGGHGNRGGNVSHFLKKYNTTKIVVYGIIDNKSYLNITKDINR